MSSYWRQHLAKQYSKARCRGIVRTNHVQFVIWPFLEKVIKSKLIIYSHKLDFFFFSNSSPTGWSRNFSPFLEPDVHYRVHGSPSLDLMLSRMNAIHTIRPDYFHFLILTTRLRPNVCMHIHRQVSSPKSYVSVRVSGQYFESIFMSVHAICPSHLPNVVDHFRVGVISISRLWASWRDFVLCLPLKMTNTDWCSKITCRLPYIVPSLSNVCKAPWLRVNPNVLLWRGVRVYTSQQICL